MGLLYKCDKPKEDTLMCLPDCINTNQSVLGSELLAWLADSSSTNSPEQESIRVLLAEKYTRKPDSDGKKIQPDVYYYVNYNNRFNPKAYVAYIVRDKVRSPKSLPARLINTDITESDDSYLGMTIQSWAYYQARHDDAPYHDTGALIVRKYLSNDHPIRTGVYYFVSYTTKGVKLFRDTERSPRAPRRS